MHARAWYTNLLKPADLRSDLNLVKKKEVQFEYTKKYTFDRETTKKVDHILALIILCKYYLLFIGHLEKKKVSIIRHMNFYMQYSPNANRETLTSL